jgi:hypothetical protein
MRFDATSPPGEPRPIVAPHRTAATRWLAYASLLGNGCFTIAVLALHLLQPERSPLNEAVSFYVHGAHGWLVTVGLVTWSLGSLALLVGLALTFRGRISSAGLWGLAVWCLGGLLGAVFPADPPGHWDQPPSVSGLIHGNAAMVAFLSLPVAALLLARPLRREPVWRPVAGASSVLALATMVSLVAFFMSLVPVFVSPGPPKLLGLTERILLSVYVVWLGVAGIGLLSSSTDRSGQKPGSEPAV